MRSPAIRITSVPLMAMPVNSMWDPSKYEMAFHRLIKTVRAVYQELALLGQSNRLEALALLLQSEVELDPILRESVALRLKGRAVSISKIVVGIIIRWHLILFQKIEKLEMVIVLSFHISRVKRLMEDMRWIRFKHLERTLKVQVQ